MVFLFGKMKDGKVKEVARASVGNGNVMVMGANDDRRCYHRTMPHHTSDGVCIVLTLRWLTLWHPFSPPKPLHSQATFSPPKPLHSQATLNNIERSRAERAEDKALQHQNNAEKERKRRERAEAEELKEALRQNVRQGGGIATRQKVSDASAME